MTRKTWKQYRKGCLTKETFDLNDPYLKVRYCKYSGCGKRLPLFSIRYYCNKKCWRMAQKEREILRTESAYV